MRKFESNVLPGSMEFGTVKGAFNDFRFTGNALTYWLEAVSESRSEDTLLAIAVAAKGILMSSSLFQKYGGFATISRMVLAFYDKALDSDQIGDFFEDIDIKRLVDHQTKFISSLLGGPAAFADDRLKQLHAHLEISDADMDEMAKLLGETLDEHGFEPTDRDLVIGEIEARRSYIVNKNAG